MSARRRSTPPADVAAEPVEPPSVEEEASEAPTPPAIEEVEAGAETTEETADGPQVTAGPLRPGELAQVSLRRESTAQWLAILIIGIFGLTTLCLVGCGFGTSLIAFLVAVYEGEGQVTLVPFDALEVAKIVLPYLATPLGVALGYYFTRRAAEQR